MKTIIFDCDGVLVDSEVLYQEIQYQAVLDLGLFYEKSAYVTRFMGSGEDNFYGSIAIEYEEKFQKPLHNSFRPDLVQKLHEEFEARLQVIPGMLELAKNIPHMKAVASSSDLNFLKEKLQWTGYDQSFGNHVYSAEQVERAKPHPDLFLFTAEKLGVSPENCIVVEDSENGVKAALAANMEVIGFCGGGHNDEAYGEKLKALGTHHIAMDAEELNKHLS